MKRLIFLAVALLALIVGGCGPYPQSSLEIHALGNQIAAQETAIAQATRDAYDNQARATAQALDLQAQAVAQAATATAVRTQTDVDATAQAVQATAVQATATRVAQDATATATREAATSTAIAAQAHAEATAVMATAQHVEREAQKEAATQALSTFGGWALLLLALVALAIIGNELLPVIVGRLRVIRRRNDEGEPIVIMERDPKTGVERIGLPLRSFWPILAGNNVAALPPLEWQDRASARAQLPAVVSAARGGRRTVRQQTQPQAGENWKEVEQPAPTWPSRVPLRGILREQPSIHNLVLGVTVRDDGTNEVVRGDISKMVHVAVGGSSGWGKSIFLQTVGLQLAQSVEPVDLALVDLEGVTFEAFARCDRLLWPIAETEQEALRVLQALTEEMNKRKENKQREGLRPIVLMVDEATALLDDKSVEGALKTLALRARKWAIWCVLGGQDWKGSSLDTAIRNQLATRVQFKAMSASQSRVLLQRGGAESLDVPGRALAILPGKPMTKIQAPWVSEDQLRTAITGTGPATALPEVITPTNGREQRIVELLNAEPGLSDSRIATIVYGYDNARVIESVRQVRRHRQTNTDSAKNGA